MSKILITILIMSQMTSCLDSEKTIPLPVVIDSHAIAYEWNDALWLLINRFSEQKTHVYKITQDHKIVLVSKLSMMSSTASSCDDQLIITGSNSVGKPIIIAINAEGEQIWNHVLSEMNPITWPVTSCGDELLLTWQESIDTLEVGSLNTKTNVFQRQSQILVETPPLTLYAWKNHMHSIWLDNKQIHDMDVSKNEKSLIERNGDYADNFTMGIADDNLYYAWATKDQVSLKFSEEKKVQSVKVENASGGDIIAVSGKEPLIWIQRADMDIDENIIWKSALVIPGKEIYKINEYVYAVSWWQDKIVVVHPNRLLILQKK